MRVEHRGQEADVIDAVRTEQYNAIMPGYLGVKIEAVWGSAG